MNEETRKGLKVFVQYWVLFALLGAFNLYNYFKKGSRFSLAVAIACFVVFVGWLIFYARYVRAKE